MPVESFTVVEPLLETDVLTGLLSVDGLPVPEEEVGAAEGEDDGDGAADGVTDGAPDGDGETVGDGVTDGDAEGDGVAAGGTSVIHILQFEGVPRVAPEGLFSIKMTCSVGSTLLSVNMFAVIVFEDSPGPKVRSPGP